MTQSSNGWAASTAPTSARTSPPPRPPAGLIQAAVRFGGQLEAARQEWFLPGTAQAVVAIDSEAGSAMFTPAQAQNGSKPGPSGPARSTAPEDGTILALDPDILFLDEPTAGLDPIGAAAFDQLILTLRDALGLTVFIVTHDLDTIYTITDRVAVIGQKRVLINDTLDAVAAADDEWIRDYFHGPRGRAAAAATLAVHAAASSKPIPNQNNEPNPEQP